MAVIKRRMRGGDVGIIVAGCFYTVRLKSDGTVTTVDIIPNVGHCDVSAWQGNGKKTKKNLITY